jgi:hypothetical protein
VTGNVTDTVLVALWGIFCVEFCAISTAAGRIC